MKKGEIYYLGIGDFARCIVQYFDMRKNHVVQFGTGAALTESYLKKSTRKINRGLWYKIIRYLNEDRRNIFN